MYDADILLDCLRNHHSKKREQTTYQKEPPDRRRLFHIGMWVCGEPLRRMEFLRLLFLSWCWTMKVLT